MLTFGRDLLYLIKLKEFHKYLGTAYSSNKLTTHSCMDMRLQHTSQHLLSLAPSFNGSICDCFTHWSVGCSTSKRKAPANACLQHVKVLENLDRTTVKCLHCLHCFNSPSRGRQLNFRRTLYISRVQAIHAEQRKHGMDPIGQSKYWFKSQTCPRTKGTGRSTTRSRTRSETTWHGRMLMSLSTLFHNLRLGSKFENVELNEKTKQRRDRYASWAGCDEFWCTLCEL